MVVHSWRSRKNNMHQKKKTSDKNFLSLLGYVGLAHVLSVFTAASAEMSPLSFRYAQRPMVELGPCASACKQQRPGGVYFI